MGNKVRYNWATLGTGVIANELAQALEKLGGKLYSVANRTYAKGVDFARKYGIEKVYDKIDELLKSGKEEDFKKAEKIVQDAPQMVSPITLFVLSARAYDLELRDDAVFWFYAAKNRAILLRGVIDMEGEKFTDVVAAIGAFMKLVGDVVNPYAFCDIKKQQEIADKALEWTKKNAYEAMFSPEFSSPHEDRKAALAKGIEKLEARNKKEKDYFLDKDNLANFKAMRKQNGTDEKFCF